MSAKPESLFLNTDSCVSLVGTQIIDNLPAAIIEPDGKIYQINELFAQLLSKEASKTIGQLHPMLQIMETAPRNLKAVEEDCRATP